MSTGSGPRRKELIGDSGCLEGYRGALIMDILQEPQTFSRVANG